MRVVGPVAVSPHRHTDGAEDDAQQDELPVVERLSVTNVAQQLDNLLTYPAVREAMSSGALNLVGMYFDISAARVYLVNPDRNTLEPLRAPAGR